MHNCKRQAAIKRPLKALVPLILFLLLLTVSCATGSAFFKWSNDTTRQFERGEIQEGYHYFYGGPQAKPNAIVAIHPDYTLKSPYWHPLTVTPESLRELVDTIKFVLYAEYKTTPNGARIIIPGGKAVGVWYSVFEYPQVKLTDEKQIYISDPQPRLPMETHRRIKPFD